MDETFPTSLLGRFRPDWIMARSRSGVVWAVTDLRDGRPLVLKRLPLTLLTEGWPRHPNLVAILEQPRWDLLLMERVRGLQLRQFQTPGERLAPDRAALLLRPVLAAVGALHAAGISHGGLHGGNVLVRSPEDPVVMEPQTGRVPVLGAAPEILCGEVPNPASDVWALGVLAHQLLTGQAPHAGAPEAMRRMILEDPLPAPCLLAPGLPPALDAWLRRSLARAAERRFADAGEMLAALEDAMTEAMTLARPRIA
jgi:serine/threonine-protein kinase